MSSEFNKQYKEDYKEASYHAHKGMGLLFKVILGVFFISLAFGILTMIVKPVFLYGDHISTKTSYQYTEGKAQEMLTMHADYQGLASRITQAQIDSQTNLAQSLGIQRAAIKTQMCNIAQIATTKSAIPLPVRIVCNL